MSCGDHQLSHRLTLSKWLNAPYRPRNGNKGRVDLPLAGLILTDGEEGEDAGDLAALLPVAGQTLVEYQARIAVACGAGQLIVLVDRMPAELVAALDRLREDGIDIEVARSVADAADRVHPDEMVIVMAGGAVAPRSVVERLAKHEAPLIMSVPDAPELGGYERIDAHHRWTGLALVTGQLLRRTATIIGDWTLGPTLLRMALQEGVRREEAEGVSIVRNAGDARQVSLRLLAHDADGGAVAIDGLLINPLVTMALPWMMTRPLPFDVVALAPWLLVTLSLIASAVGWHAAAFGLFVLSAVPAVAARRMAGVAARRSRLLELFERARSPVFFGLLLLQGWALVQAGLGWGSLLLSTWAGIALLLQPSIRRSLWMADVGWAAVILLAAAVFGQPLAGLAVLVAYAVITQFLLVRAIR